MAVVIRVHIITNGLLYKSGDVRNNRYLFHIRHRNHL